MQSAIIVGYLIIMVVLGLYFAKSRVRDSADFMVAGRSLSYGVLIGTLVATFIGSGSIIGGASFVYQHGPLAAIFFFAGTPIGILILYFFLAHRIRAAAIYTIPEIIEKRYGRFARGMAALIILLAYVGIVSYQFIGGGYALNVTLGLPVWEGALISAVVMIFLAMIGGLVSVAYTDFISSIIIFLSLLIALPIALMNVGGLSDMFAALPAAKQSWTGGLTTVQLLGYFLPLFLLLLGDQNIYQRFSAARDATTARRSAAGFFIGAILINALIILLVATTIVAFPDIKPDTAVLVLGARGVPDLLGGFILAATVGLIITTGNSYLLSSAGNLVHDLYVNVFGRRIAESRRLLVDRGTVVALGVFAYCLGTFFPSVLAIQMYSYTMYGAAITPALIAALVWRGATVPGGVASILVGGAATLIWEIALGKPLELNSVLISLPLSVLTLIVVSLLTQQRCTPLIGEQTE
ncbi:sodium:solute symporter family protein [Salinisphaera aquimarina]|uniref:Sodium:solute symporter n=1 Tax=Salinisphaera aquimarina TaxID=2094031 RepID=A0ABV7EPC3_9GAMM